MLVSDSTHMPPTGTNRPVGDALADAGEQLGLVLAHPRVLLGRRAANTSSSSVVHQLQRVGERAGDLADGLAHRPQPRRVDVRVAHGVRRGGRWRARAGRARRPARRGPPRRWRRRRPGPRRRPRAPGPAAPRPGGGGRRAAPRPARSTSRCPAAAPTPCGPGRRARPRRGGRAGRRPRWRGRRAGSAPSPSRRSCRGWPPPRRRGRRRRPPGERPGGGVRCRRGSTPSGAYTVPSAWKPGPAPVKPRSTTSSGCRHCAGTEPVTWNHAVPHGRPHASPTANGRYSCLRASANGTGSPGAVHAATRAGTLARCSAGVSRSRTKRATRGRTKPESSCTGPSCPQPIGGPTTCSP